MNASATNDSTSVKPFTRVMTTPPAWPWDQTRAARMEAEHTSPISGTEVTIHVKRLKPWSFNETGEFVAVYVRGIDPLGEGFDVEVKGRRIRIEQHSRAKRDLLAKHRFAQLCSAGVILIVLVGLTTLALQRRAVLEDRITQAEVRAQKLARQSAALAKAKKDARALAVMDLRGQTLESVVSDLDRVSSSLNSDARIEVFHWRRGYWALEARGDQPPVGGIDRDLQRSSKPVRRGVWLWVAKSGEDQRP